MPRSAPTAAVRSQVAQAPRSLALARPARFSVDQVNAINLGLMLVSAGVAWVAPFELLLVSYTILGPLHYVTEISWLHDRRYFTSGRYDALPLIAVALLGLANYTALVGWDGWIVLALALAVAFAFAAGWPARAAIITLGVAVTIALQSWLAAWIFLLVLVPTVVHVYCFTGLFILQGCVKTGSRWGYASLAVFAACGLGLLLYRPPAAPYEVGERATALANEFSPVIEELTILFRTPWKWDNIMAFARFLAFAYTYHYLNWFSKTGIIRWHAVGTQRLTAVGVVYAAALALYAYDYHVGFVALFALSLAHVLLELPLDLRTLVTLTARRVPA